MKLNKIGDRMTRPRRLIFEALSKLEKPVTVLEIHHYLKNEIDLTSIYRTLDLLKKSDLLNVILFGEGKKRYELKKDHGHHHHLVCENCGGIEDIEMHEDNLLKNVAAHSEFLVKKHNLEFFGLCKNCQ